MTRTKATAAGFRKASIRPVKIQTKMEPVADQAAIPEPLADATILILGLHATNGDLAWVEDMLAEIEAQQPRAAANPAAALAGKRPRRQ